MGLGDEFYGESGYDHSDIQEMRRSRMAEKDPNELGALWLKSSSRGDYMTGTVGGVAVVVFPNDRKTPGSKQPDYRVLKAKPRGETA